MDLEEITMRFSSLLALIVAPFLLSGCVVEYNPDIREADLLRDRPDYGYDLVPAPATVTRSVIRSTSMDVRDDGRGSFCYRTNILWRSVGRDVEFCRSKYRDYSGNPTVIYCRVTSANAPVPRYNDCDGSGYYRPDRNCVVTVTVVDLKSGRGIRVQKPCYMSDAEFYDYRWWQYRGY